MHTKVILLSLFSILMSIIMRLILIVCFAANRLISHFKVAKNVLAEFKTWQGEQHG